MRIGIDGSCWNNNRGFGRFTRELLGELFKIDAGHSYHLLTDGPLPSADLGLMTEVHNIAAGKTVVESATADGRRAIGDMLAFRRTAARLRLDVLFYPAVYSWFPPPRRLPSVVTFHDAIAEHFPELVFPKARHRTMWNAKTWMAKKTATRILTVSEAARREIVEYLHIPSGSIDVICEGAGAVFCPVSDHATQQAVRSAMKIPRDGRFLIYVGGFAPHKNLERLLNGFALALRENGAEDLRLVMTGDPGGGGFHSNFAALQKRSGAPDLLDRVHFTGYVSDLDLAALYSGALALVFPSLSEGFGLPALEAMNCATPVLAAQDGAVMEVAGRSGLAFDPMRPDSIADAITQIATVPDLRTTLAAATAAEAARNTWPKAAELTLAALEHTARSR